MHQTLKELLGGEEVLRVFSLGRIVDPTLIELFGLAGGYHGFWLDGEHRDLTTEQIVTSAITARANGFDCFVRIPPIGYWRVSQCLDSGAGGVMVAQIHSAAQAAEFVSWTKFAPQGCRGLHGDSRDADYTWRPIGKFVEESNRDHFVAIQIETLGAVAEAEAIAALEGVDMLFVGPSDLSLVLGVAGQFQHDSLWEAIDRVADACANQGKAWGTLPPDPEFGRRAVEKGCRMLSIANGTRFIRAGIEAVGKSYAGVFG